MSVTVDDVSIPAEKLGLRTVGQLLSHLQRDNRLIVHVLIDGEEPDLARLPALRQSLLNGHTLFIETTEPAGDGDGGARRGRIAIARGQSISRRCRDAVAIQSNRPRDGKAPRLFQHLAECAGIGDEDGSTAPHRSATHSRRRQTVHRHVESFHAGSCD